MIEELLGTTLNVFFVITVLIMGFAAFMTGQGMANTWRRWKQCVFYSILLGFADRFLVFALFQGELFSISGFIIDTAVLTLICLTSFRLAQVQRMVRQYEWEYEKAGPFSWRRRDRA